METTNKKITLFVVALFVVLGFTLAIKMLGF